MVIVNATVTANPLQAEVPVALVVTAKPAHAALPYQVTLVKLPQAGVVGWVHIEVADAVADVQVPLPKALQEWIVAAGADLKLENADAVALEGVSLTEDGAFLRLVASGKGRFPPEVVLRSAQGQIVLRIVNSL